MGETLKTKHKILFLVTEDWYFWSHRLPVARAAKKQGYEVVIATRVQDHGNRIRSEGFTLVPISLIRRSTNPLRELAVIYEITRVYRTHRPDIVHHVALKPVLYGSLAARLAGIKNVANALTGLGYVFIAEGAKAAFLRSVVKILFHACFAARNTRVIFQNNEDRLFFINQGIISPDKTVLIRGSGVNINHFSPSPEHDGEPKIILASRMLWDKGVGDLVEAAKILKSRKIPGKIVLAGRPDPENPAAIPEKTLAQWNREGIISWKGHVDNIADLLRKCHIAVLPSYREGVPKSLLEAAASGLPLVATDVPGCREVVKPDKNGFLVPPKDPESLAKAFTILLKNRELRKKFGLASRKIAENEFSEKLVIDETLTLYKELAKRNAL
ncbi:MAG: glycosyltransferase family 4 protein [Desulfobulbaceae bacterium]|nr:glycosyltransferase family 4 protein [Desulfobulbaceae bacterium]